MPSNYPQIPVNFRLTEGDIQPVPANVTVKVYNTVTQSDIATLQTDANGFIAAGQLNVDAGTLVRFRVENYQGMAMSVSLYTT